MSLKNRLFLFATVALFGLLVANRLFSLSTVDNDYVGYNNGLYSLLLTIVILAWGDRYNLPKIDFLLFFLFLCALPSVFINSSSLISLILNIVTILAPLVGMAFGKTIFEITNEKPYKNLSVLLLASPFFYCLIYLSLALFRQTIDLTIIRDTALLLICYIPFLLLLDSKTIKYILMVVTFYFLLVFAKRTSIIYILVILLCAIIGDAADEKESSIKKIGIFSIILLLSFAIFSCFGIDDDTFFVVIDRFNGISDDGGSGRSDQYQLIINHLNNSSDADIFFGHGPGTVAKTTGIPAHNDILEIFFDYGFFAGLFYLAYMITIIIRSAKCLRNKNISVSYRSAYFGIILGYVVFVNMNCVFINPLYSILLLSIISYYDELIKGSQQNVSQ